MIIELFKLDKLIFLTWLAGVIFLEILSFFTFVQASLINYFSFLIVILFLVITLKNLSWGMLGVFAELILGVYGYLFVFTIGDLVLPVRYMFFIIWISVWLTRVFLIEQKKLLEILRKKWRLITGLMFIIFSGIILGFINNNDFADIFFDVNSWFYWLYFIPFLMYTISWKNLWPAVAALISWVAIKTIILEYLFSHKFSTVQWWLYYWFRDFRLAEITPITGSLNRIFSQNQIFLLLLFICLLFYFIYLQQKQINYFFSFLVIILLSSIFISFSRSFWLGLVGAIVIWLAMFIVKKYYVFFPMQWKNIAIYPLAFVCISIVMVFISVNFPYPDKLSVGLDSFLTARFAQGLEEPAVNARLNMLPVLFEKISKNWLVGSGFGTTVTFNSTDPRIVSASAGQTGLVTTYAFEWGYFDIWLKVGLLGLLIYLVVLLKLLFNIFRMSADLNSVFLAGLGVAYIALLILNITTPYLNHPLGIGYILLILALAQSYKAQVNKYE